METIIKDLKDLDNVLSYIIVEAFNKQGYICFVKLNNGKLMIYKAIDKDECLQDALIDLNFQGFITEKYIE